MNNTAILFGKLSGLYKSLSGYFKQRDRSGFPIELGKEFFDRYAELRNNLCTALPSLYSDLPVRKVPEPKLRVSGGHVIYGLPQLEQLLHDMEYIFEVRANSELASVEDQERPQRIFISHGNSSDWREVQAYIEKDLETDTLELAQEPNRGRTILQKLDEESAKCSFAVVVMTGDDAIKKSAPRVRENVMHEIGFFQGRFGLASVCLLHEEGANIPSNIHGVVYIPFPKGLVSATFGVLSRELRAAFDD